MAKQNVQLSKWHSAVFLSESHSAEYHAGSWCHSCLKYLLGTRQCLFYRILFAFFFRLRAVHWNILDDTAAFKPIYNQCWSQNTLQKILFIKRWGKNERLGKLYYLHASAKTLQRSITLIQRFCNKFMLHNQEIKLKRW